MALLAAASLHNGKSLPITLPAPFFGSIKWISERQTSSPIRLINPAKRKANYRYCSIMPENPPTAQPIVESTLPLCAINRCYPLNSGTYPSANLLYPQPGCLPAPAAAKNLLPRSCSSGKEVYFPVLFAFVLALFLVFLHQWRFALNGLLQRRGQLILDFGDELILGDPFLGSDLRQ